jgi:hypothetical protein
MHCEIGNCLFTLQFGCMVKSKPGGAVVEVHGSRAKNESDSWSLEGRNVRSHDSKKICLQHVPADRY